MYEYKCEIDRVVDGDTVDVIIDCGFSIFHKARVRMYGIDTPESRTRDKDEKARGLMSKDFLVKELSKGDVVIKTKKDKKGKFGRILGELYVDDININQMMIHGFYAVAYDGQSKEEIEKEHIKNRQTLIAKGWFDPDSI
jgi:micrococcal nuclease|tara:strand:- start:388 stop:807 length:420 start_codon:yes stop_codon:yes gene_type:complete